MAASLLGLGLIVAFGAAAQPSPPAIPDAVVRKMIELGLKNIHRALCDGFNQCKPATPAEFEKPPISIEQARVAVATGVRSAFARWCGFDADRRSVAAAAAAASAGAAVQRAAGGADGRHSRHPAEHHRRAAQGDRANATRRRAAGSMPSCRNPEGGTDVQVRCHLHQSAERAAAGWHVQPRRAHGAGRACVHRGAGRGRCQGQCRSAMAIWRRRSIRCSRTSAASSRTSAPTSSRWCSSRPI